MRILRIPRYLFHDHCEARGETHGTMACGGPDAEPTLPSYSVRCPDHCKLELVARPKFNISGGSIGDRRQQTMTIAGR